jgi:carboxymethylenebutenolidase
MELNARWVTHERDGQTIEAYQVSPLAAKTPLPAVVVIQEIWGPDEHIQDLTRRIAEAGYTALAPDLWAHGGSRPEPLKAERINLLKMFMETVPTEAWHHPEKMQQSLAQQGEEKARLIQETQATLFGPRDTEGMLKDLTAWLDYLGNAPESRGMPVATTGYCMGGMLSFQLATRDRRPRVALVYYGNAPDPEAMARIQCPVHGFYGGTDHGITDKVPEVAEDMKKRGKDYGYTIYPDAGHAFFNDTRKSYHVGAARDAWAKTLSLLAQHLS